MKKNIALVTAATALLSAGAQAEDLLAYTMLGTGPQIRQELAAQKPTPSNTEGPKAPVKAGSPSAPRPAAPMGDATDKSSQGSCGTGKGGQGSCGADKGTQQKPSGDKSGQASCGAGKGGQGSCGATGPKGPIQGS